MMWSQKLLICIALGLAVVGTQEGCSSNTSPEPKPQAGGTGDRSKPTDSGKPAERPQKDADDSSKLKPRSVEADFPLMSAQDFAKEFVTDEAGAKKKYYRKKVHLEGTVVDNQVISGIHSMKIAGFKGEKGRMDVRCGIAMIDEFTAAQVKEKKAGDKIALFGEVYLIDNPSESIEKRVGLSSCYIVK